MTLPRLLRSLVPLPGRRPRSAPASRRDPRASGVFRRSEQGALTPFQEAELAGPPVGTAREAVRAGVARAVGADADDAVLFVDAAISAGLAALIDLVGLGLSPERPARAQAQRPVVFVSADEPPCNLLVWQRSAARMESIPVSAGGALDLTVLKAKLIKYSTRGMAMIGSFSAASSVSGALRDVDGISGLLHAYGALAFWDYTSAGADASVEMHPERLPWHMGCPHKDALLLGPRVFAGAAWTRGILVLNRALAQRELELPQAEAAADHAEVRAI